MEVGSHGLSTDVAIGLSDAELAREIYGWIRRVGQRGDLESQVISDALYFLASETFERFVPEVEIAEVQERYADEPGELEAALAGLRRRAAARMIRDAFGDDRG